MKAAGRLGMEFGVSETCDVPGPGTPEVNAVQLIPTDKTYEIIERWQSIQEDYPHIDFPEEDCLSQNWYEVSDALDDIKEKYGRGATNESRDENLGKNE